MRIAPIAFIAPLLLLASCDWQNGQGNNAQANISAEGRVASNAIGTTVATPTGAPKTKDEALKIMHERHEGMEKIGKATKAAMRELKAGSPDLGTIRESAKTIGDLAPHVTSWFPPGTGPDVGKTGAKPEIWQNNQDFTGKAGDFQKAAQAFSAAAGGSDINAIKESFATLGNSCKACHDKYRKEMKH
jgi:cytochrome c556